MPTRGKAVKIAAGYFVLGALWIFWSGWLLHHFVHDEKLVAWLEFIKGWFFVTVTALLLGWSLSRYFRGIRRSAEGLLAEERRLRLIGDNLPNSYVYQCTTEADGRSRFTYLSAGVERVHGLRAEDILRDASGLFEQVDPAQLPAYAAAGMVSASLLKDFEMDLSLRLGNGMVRVVRLHSRPWRNDAGQVYWDGFAIDITAERQEEELRLQAERNYREIFNATNEAIFIHDAVTGEVLDVNEPMVRMYGYASKDEFLSMNKDELYVNRVPFHLEDGLAHIRRAVEEGPQVFEWLTRKKKGEEMWVEVSLSNTQIGGQGRVLAVARDITRRKEQELEIERLTRLYATLSQVNQTIVRCQNREELFAGICRVMVEFGKFQGVRIGECAEAGGQVKMVAEILGGSESPLVLPAEGCEVIEEAMGSGRSSFCNECAANHGAGGQQDPACGWGIRSCAAFPLKVGEEVRGVFSVGSSEQDFFLPEEVRLLEEIGSDISYALERMEGEAQRREAEEKLLGYQRRIEAAFGSMTEAVFITDAEGELIEYNEAFAIFHRYKSKGDCPKTVAEFRRVVEVCGMNGGAAPPGERPVSRALAGETRRNLELTFRRTDTGEVWAGNCSFAPLRDAKGGVAGAVVVCRDITEQKEAQEALRELNRTLDQRVHERTAELRASNEELDSFAHAVSHDLRAPLRAMSGFSQALGEEFGEDLAPAGREYIDLIQAGSRQMGELIDGLLSLSRSTRGELKWDRVDLSALAGKILGRLQQAEPQRAVTSVVEPGLAVTGDARLLEVVLTNLLGNAWKYTGRTGAPVIRVYGQADGRSTTISVADNGAGFDMKQAGSLFQPFRRLHTEEAFPGIGIGLATVQRIIRRHRGTLRAEGAPGAGVL